MQPFDRNKRWPKIGTPPLFGEVGLGPHLPQSYLHGLGPTSVPSGILMHPAVCLFSGDSWVAIEHKVAWAEENLDTKWHLSPSSRLTTTDIGRKLGVCAPLEVGSWGSV